jgi:hypothetical protein
MTNKEAVSRIRAMFKLISSDDDISDRAILSELRSTTHQEIKRQTDKRKLLASPNIFTEIPCVEMVEANLVECCSYVSDCKIARSKYKLPKIGENIYGLLMRGVYSIDRSTSFSFITPTRYSNYVALKTKRLEDFYWVYDGYLYISNPLIEMVSVSAYFEEDVDPLLFSCSGDGGNECPPNPLDLEFKCPGFLEDAIMLQVMTKFAKTYKQSIADQTEDDMSTTR